MRCRRGGPSINLERIQTAFFENGYKKPTLDYSQYAVNNWRW